MLSFAFLINGLLPNSEECKNHLLFNICLEKKPIGIVWIEFQSPNIVYGRDFEIYEQYRGQGYGKQTIDILMDMKSQYPQFKKIISWALYGCQWNAVEMVVKRYWIHGTSLRATFDMKSCPICPIRYWQLWPTKKLAEK